MLQEKVSDAVVTMRGLTILITITMMLLLLLIFVFYFFSYSNNILPAQSQHQDVEEGPILGSGAFSVVRGMRRKVPKCDSCARFGTIGISKRPEFYRTSSLNTSLTSSFTDTSTATSVTGKSCCCSMEGTHCSDDQSVTLHCSSEDETPYAIKQLKCTLTGSTKISGVIDLAIEAQFLSKLSSPYIVTLHAMGGEPGSKDFFIVIDRVERTLGKAIKTWGRKESSLKTVWHNRDRHGGSTISRKGKQARLQYDFDQRITVVHQMALGLKYLHENS